MNTRRTMAGAAAGVVLAVSMVLVTLAGPASATLPDRDGVAARTTNGQASISGSILWTTASRGSGSVTVTDHSWGNTSCARLDQRIQTVDGWTVWQHVGTVCNFPGSYTWNVTANGGARTVLYWQFRVKDTGSNQLAYDTNRPGWE